jgi:hypothetical protein
VEHWNGATWSQQPTPTLPARATGKFSGVSCTAPAACTAVGSYGNPDVATLTLAERFAG